MGYKPVSYKETRKCKKLDEFIYLPKRKLGETKFNIKKEDDENDKQIKCKKKR